MDIQIKNEDGAVILDINGDVNISSSPSLRTMLKEHVDKGASRIIVRLADVNYMDSSGVGVLVSGLKLAKEKKIPFGLVEISKNVMAVIEVTRLVKIFNIFSDLPTALADLK